MAEEVEVVGVEIAGEVNVEKGEDEEVDVNTEKKRRKRERRR